MSTDSFLSEAIGRGLVISFGAVKSQPLKRGCSFIWEKNMGTKRVTLRSLGDWIFRSAREELGSGADAVKKYLKTESEKLAITLRMILEGAAKGEISPEEAKILLQMQKTAARSVLTAAEGLSVLTAEAAINSALGAVKDFVNSRVGFPLL